jgi:hypothetical protein
MTQPGHFRAFARRPVNLKATLCGPDGSWAENVRLLDLGLGGACIEASELPLQRGLSLQLLAPHLWDPLVVGAEAAWSQPSPDGSATRVGLRFEPRTGATLRALNELLLAQSYE